MPSSSENIGTKLEEIVTALGRYYGATSRSDFVSMLLLRERDLPRNAFEIPDTTPAIYFWSSVLCLPPTAHCLLS